MATPPTLLDLTVGAGGALVCAIAITWLATRWWYGKRIAELRARSRKHEQSHSSLQDKQAGLISQLDSLRSELRTQKALASSLSSQVNERRQVADKIAQVEALNEPFITSRAPRKPLDFEDTQIL